jgi:hypothetical protein
MTPKLGAYPFSTIAGPVSESLGNIPQAPAKDKADFSGRPVERCVSHTGELPSGRGERLARVGNTPRIIICEWFDEK